MMKLDTNFKIYTVSVLAASALFLSSVGFSYLRETYVMFDVISNYVMLVVLFGLFTFCMANLIKASQEYERVKQEQAQRTVERAMRKLGADNDAVELSV